MQAAGDAAVIFRSINDIENAYLWSLRCTGQCTRANGVIGSDVINISLPDLEKLLPYNAILRMQAAAQADTAVVPKR